MGCSTKCSPISPKVFFSCLYVIGVVLLFFGGVITYTAFSERKLPDPIVEQIFLPKNYQVVDCDYRYKIQAIPVIMSDKVAKNFFDSTEKEFLVFKCFGRELSIYYYWEDQSTPVIKTKSWKKTYNISNHKDNPSGFSSWRTTIDEGSNRVVHKPVSSFLDGIFIGGIFTLFGLILFVATVVIFNKYKKEKRSNKGGVR